MTDRWSRGYWVRMSVSSATATFLAARKQPRSSIERLMSTRRTVAVRVSCSVRKTSKSSARRGAPPDRHAPRGPPGRSPRGPARWSGSRAGRGGTGRRTRTASSSRRAPRPGRHARSGGRRTRRAGAGRTGRRGPSGRSCGCRAASARAAPRRGSGSRPPRAVGRASSSASRSRTASSPIRSRTSSRSMRARSPGPSTSVRASSRRSMAARRSICGERAVEAQRLVATEPDALAEAARQEQVQVRGELREVEQEPVVAQERVHHRLELGPLLGGHRAHERLHRGHPLGELVDDVVEGPRAREEPPVLGEELRGVRGRRRRSARACRSLRSRTISRFAARSSGVIDRIASDIPPTNWSSTCLPRRSTRAVEALARGGLEEVVLAQVADPVADVRRQGVEAVQALGRHVAEHAREGQASAAGSVASLERSSRRSTPRPLLLHDLVELAADVAEHVAQLVALEQLLASARQSVHEVLEAGQVRAGRVVRSASHAPSGAAAPRRGRPRPSRRPRAPSMISSASRSGSCWLPVPARVPGAPGQRASPGCAPSRPAGMRPPRSRGSGE